MSKLIENMDYLLSLMTEQEIGIAEAVAQKLETNKSFDDIAADFGICTKTLYTIRNRPHIRELITAFQAIALMDSRSNVDKKLMSAVDKGNMKAIELFYKLTGMLETGVTIETNVNIGGRQPKVIDAYEVADRMAELEAKLKSLE